MEHTIIVVGIGPGSPDYILPAARKELDAARVLIGSQRALNTFGSEKVVQKVIDKDIDGVLKFIEESIQVDNVVVMVSGDPGYYSLLTALRRRFSAGRLRVIPGISSVQLAFARLALPWQDAILTSMHGRTANPEDIAYVPGKVLGILTDQLYTSTEVAKTLISANWPPETSAWVCSNLSYEQETVVAGTLQGFSEMQGVAHCVMVVTE